MNIALLNKEVQDFISENYKTPVPEIVLKGSPFKKVSVQELAVQVTGKRKAEKKLPTWYNTRGIIYPPGLNLEQTSSEITAAYKAGLVGKKTLLDLTGGFGVDSYFFARNLKKVIHCEENAELSALAKHNATKLNIENITFISGDGIAYLKETSAEFDWIYIDPSRRNEKGGRVFRLSDCLPDVPALLPLLFRKTSKILLKTAPLLDISAGISALKNVKEIHIIAINNDVKELIWILEKGCHAPVKIKTRNKKPKGDEVYEKEYNSPANTPFSEPIKYLYEPNAAIMKSGLFQELGQDYQVLKLHSNTHLFTSEELQDFPGRRFKIQKIIRFNRKKIKAALDFENAHISTRNFPQPVSALRKQFKLKDGGDRYLFFTTTLQDQKILLICTKVPTAHTPTS